MTGPTLVQVQRGGQLETHYVTGPLDTGFLDELRPPPPPPPPPVARPRPAPAGLALTIGGVAAGLFGGGMTLGAHAAAGFEPTTSSRTLQGLSWAGPILAGVGGAVAASGVVVLTVGPRQQVALTPTPNGVRLAATY